jgi:hypothetical protein
VSDDVNINIDADIDIDIEFGDDDPEDAYAAEDPVEERLGVLERVVMHLREHRDERFELRRQAALVVVAEIGDQATQRNVTRRVDEIYGALEEMA